ncbi:hypothetical protein RYX36_017641 [Vicia faba]
MRRSLYNLLNSIDPTTPWTTLYPHGFCISPPPFLHCDSKSHIVQLNFGFISDQTHLLPCSPNATLQDPLLFTAFPYLRKISFSNCFTNTHKPIHSIPSFPPSLQDLLFIDNPSFVSPLQPFLTNLTASLKKLVLIGNGFYGELPQQIGAFHDLLELTLSRNNLSGEIPASIGSLKKLEILDLSHNGFNGCVPQQVGSLISLSKLNLSYNSFGCKIPETFIHLKNLEFLDLSFNRFGKFGVPLFLGQLSKIKQVYLSGNKLSGEIPEIWEKLGAVEKIGFSNMGLVGEIPASMVVYLENLSYLGLDNNNLQGRIPDGFWYLLPFVDEINLENNNLTGRMEVTCGGVVVLKKMKLAGNIGYHLNITSDGCSSCPKGGTMGHSKRNGEF